MIAPLSSLPEIDRAVELLATLKAVSPDIFAQAMARLAADPDPSDAAVHASSFALGLVKGQHSAESARALLDMSDQLPRLPSGALGVVARPKGIALSLASKAISLHGMHSPWALFFARSIRDGAMPMDPDCAFDIACRLDEFVEGQYAGDGEQSAWLGHPDNFHEAFAAFFDWRCDWRDICHSASFDFMPWALDSWLSVGGAASCASATRACRRLMASGAAKSPKPFSWLAFSRWVDVDDPQNSFDAMLECLALEQAASGSQGAPCIDFCERAMPTPFMAPALARVAAFDPQGLFAVDSLGRSAVGWLNSRLRSRSSEEWQAPILACFAALVALGADPRHIVERVDLAAHAAHPSIAAAIEAAELAASLEDGEPRPPKRL